MTAPAWRLRVSNVVRREWCRVVIQVSSLRRFLSGYFFEHDAGLFRAAVVITVPWAAFVLIYPLVFAEDSAYWGQIRLGETGDYLAGWLTPLAFFWFVIAVLLQRRELIEQRKQFEKTTIAQEEQARSLQRSNEGLRRQIGVLTEQYQADTILRTWSVGRELQLKALGEPSLAHLLPGPKDTAFIGIIINHYAELFELHRLNALTETGWDSFQRDMAAFFGNPSIREIWRSLMPYHNDEFVKFVQEELLVRCGAGGTEEGRKGQEDDAN